MNMSKKKLNKNNVVNSNAYAYLKSLLSPRINIIDIEVRGKWLRASLSSGIYFSVKNQDTD